MLWITNRKKKICTFLLALLVTKSGQKLQYWLIQCLHNSPGPLAHCQQGASHQDHTPVPQASHATISSARKEGISASCCLFISEKSFPRSLHNVPSRLPVYSITCLCPNLARGEKDYHSCIKKGRQRKKLALPATKKRE